MVSWPALLNQCDFSAARAACLQEFASAPEASWALAEVEERWGDSFFFNGEPGAMEHYVAARTAFIPVGSQFTDAAESDRRMEGFQRVVAKIYAIDPYGLARTGNECRPHPNSRPIARQAPAVVELAVEAVAEPIVEPVVEAHAEAVVEPAVEPAKPSKAARLAAVVQSRETRLRQATELARLFATRDHWAHYFLAVQWREAGEGLAGVYPQGAGRAYAWSMYFFELYNKAWNAHMPASRWDSDGGQEMMEVQNLMNALASVSSEPPLPDWVEALLAGDLPHAVEEPVAPPFEAVWALLKTCEAKPSE